MGHRSPTRGAASRPTLGMLVVLLIAAGASVATSPAHRSASVDYQEELRLTAANPAAIRYLTLDVLNRDTVHGMTLGASAQSEVQEDDMIFLADTEGVSVTLLSADPALSLPRDPLYSGPNLGVHQQCRRECTLGIWAIVRLDDAPSLAPQAEVATRLEVSFFATGDEGTQELDMELSIEKDADRSFDGSPTVVTASTEGRLRVSSEHPEVVEHFRLILAADELEGDLRFPLVAEISVDARDVAASDHPNAHDTYFSFDSPFLAPDAQVGGWDPYSYLRVWGDDYEPAQRLDLLPLCAAATRCEIDVTLQSMYDAMLNSPDFEVETAPPGFVELDWFMTVRLEAFDGRQLTDDLLLISRDAD